MFILPLFFHFRVCMRVWGFTGLCMHAWACGDPGWHQESSSIILWFYSMSQGLSIKFRAHWYMVSFLCQLALEITGLCLPRMEFQISSMSPGLPAPVLTPVAMLWPLSPKVSSLFISLSFPPFSLSLSFSPSLPLHFFPMPLGFLMSSYFHFYFPFSLDSYLFICLFYKCVYVGFRRQLAGLGSLTMWVLGTELRTLGLAVGSSTHWAISPTPHYSFNMIIICHIY